MIKHLLISLFILAIPSVASAQNDDEENYENSTTCNSNRRGEVFVDTTEDIRAGKDETHVALLCGKTGWQRLNSVVTYDTLSDLEDEYTGIQCKNDNSNLSLGLTAIIKDIDGKGNSGQVYCGGVEWKNADGSPAGSGEVGTSLSEVLNYENVASREIRMAGFGIRHITSISPFNSYLDLTDSRIGGLVEPQADDEAATKRYVDLIVDKLELRYHNCDGKQLDTRGTLTPGRNGQGLFNLCHVAFQGDKPYLTGVAFQMANNWDEPVYNQSSSIHANTYIMFVRCCEARITVSDGY